jgi:hypothetical protein
MIFIFFVLIVKASWFGDPFGQIFAEDNFAGNPKKFVLYKGAATDCTSSVRRESVMGVLLPVVVAGFLYGCWPLLIWFEVCCPKFMPPTHTLQMRRRPAHSSTARSTTPSSEHLELPRAVPLLGNAKIFSQEQAEPHSGNPPVRALPGRGDKRM